MEDDKPMIGRHTTSGAYQCRGCHGLGSTMDNITHSSTCPHYPSEEDRRQEMEIKSTERI